MSRSEFYREGRVPLHTLRADVDYGFHEAKTTFGGSAGRVGFTRGPVRQTGVRAAQKGARTWPAGGPVRVGGPSPGATGRREATSGARGGDRPARGGARRREDVTVASEPGSGGGGRAPVSGQEADNRCCSP